MHTMHKKTFRTTELNYLISHFLAQRAIFLLLKDLQLSRGYIPLNTLLQS